MAEGGGTAPSPKATTSFLLHLLIRRVLIFLFLFLLFLFFFFLLLLILLCSIGPASGVLALSGSTAVSLAVPLVVISQGNPLAAPVRAWRRTTPRTGHGVAGMASNERLCSGADVHEPALPAA